MHILSLIFGMASWGMACAAIGRRGGYGLCFGSFTLCAGALMLQLYELRRLILVKDDFWATYDTIGAVCFASSVLVGVTVVLNAIVLLRSRKQ